MGWVWVFGSIHNHTLGKVRVSLVNAQRMQSEVQGEVQGTDELTVQCSQVCVCSNISLTPAQHAASPGGLCCAR